MAGRQTAETGSPQSELDVLLPTSGSDSAYYLVAGLPTPPGPSTGVEKVSDSVPGWSSSGEQEAEVNPRDEDADDGEQRRWAVEQQGVFVEDAAPESDTDASV